MKNNKKINRKLIVIICLVLLLLLGALLGASITTFVLFLHNKQDSLAILSYIFIIAFVVVLVVVMSLINTYSPYIFAKKTKPKKGNNHEQE